MPVRLGPKAAGLAHCQPRQNQHNDSAGKHGDDRYLSLGEKRLGSFPIWNCHLAIVLDYAHHVIAQLSNVRRHRVFIGELFPVKHEPFLHRAVVQRFFVSDADLTRQFCRAGIFLPVVTNLSFQRNAHRRRKS